MTNFIEEGVIMGYIYKITNKVNGKIYIGQTMQSVEKRFKEHINAAKTKYSGNRYALQHAILKYGEDAFTIEVLGEYPEELLDEMEIMFIQEFNSLKPNGYNITLGGCGTRGYKHTDETKRLLTQNLHKRWDTMTPEEYEDACRKRSEALKGIPKSDEHKRKLSELAKQRTGEKNPFYGKKHTEETKRKIAEKAKGRDNGMGQPIKCVKDGVEMTFPSINKAAIWLMENGYAKSRNACSIVGTIQESVNGDCKRYGFKWFLVE